MGYIYKITNTVNNKAYVGVTIQQNVVDRWNAHKSSIRNGRGCPFLAKAFKKYGEDAFRFEVIIICFDKDVYKYEIDYIKKYNTLSPNGYNILEGGKSNKTFLGKTHTEETKKILSKKSKEYNNRPEVKEWRSKIMKELNKKRFANPEVIKKMEENKIKRENKIANKKSKSDVAKEYYNLNTLEGQQHREKHKELMRKVLNKPVSQYSKEGVLIASFESVKDATNKTGIRSGNISSMLTGRNKTAGGFIWKYDKKEPKDSSTTAM